MSPRLRFTTDDLWLLLMVSIWGMNLTVLKVVFREMPPLAFNAVRFGAASLAFAALIRRAEGSGATWIPRGDLGKVAVLGLLGHTGYQMCFVLGLHRTTATHTSLIFGTTPLVIALLSTWRGHERLGWPMWCGLVSSATGVVLTVSGRQEQAGRALSTLAGDALILCGVLLWALYSVFSKPLLSRYSALRLTGLSMMAGTLPLVLIALPQSFGVEWGAVSLQAWAGVGFSALLAVVLCYAIWFRSVARVGNARTAVYGNLVPVFGSLFAVALLGEPFSGQLALGAVFILGGIVLTRLRYRTRAGAVVNSPRSVRQNLLPFRPGPTFVPADATDATSQRSRGTVSEGSTLPADQPP